MDLKDLKSAIAALTDKKFFQLLEWMEDQIENSEDAGEDEEDIVDEEELMDPSDPSRGVIEFKHGAGGGRY